MAGYSFFFVVNILKYHQCFSCQRASVKSKYHLHTSIRLRWRKYNFRSHRFSIDQKFFPGLLIHQHASQCVLLSGDQVMIGHCIKDCSFLLRSSHLTVCCRVLCLGLNRGEYQCLIFAVQIFMRTDLLICIPEFLKHHYGLTCQCTAIKSKDDFGCTGRFLCSKFSLSSHFFSIH